MIRFLQLWTSFPSAALLPALGLNNPNTDVSDNFTTSIFRVSEKIDRIQKKAAQFTNHTKDCDWETLAQHRTIELFKAYSGERAWKATRDRLRRSYYLSRLDHVRKIRDRKQRMDIGKYFFVDRTIKNWNQLTAEALGSFSRNPKICRQRFRKAIINRVKWRE